ncbi:DNA repair protein RadC [Cyclobacterium sp.]|uniref:JAB domain-containing protein n=1 Tax=Cyclobacterium sp. TaxID=1966343 RepID=UPI001988007E|nr:DNA repair protein RadC [Cyclobacterium sp.]MBD3630520.1 DNA repair protein RadC [Cyclobacterium sp.]
MRLKEPIQTLYEKGKAAMSDTMLISAAFNLPEQTAKEILRLANFNLGNLAKVSTKELMKIRYISHSKAAAIVSTFEIGRRRWIATPEKKVKISSSTDAYDYFRPFLMDEVVEYFYILLINRSNHVICHKLISQGGTSATIADPKLIFKHALDHLANAVILIHNHPSGNLKPSQADITLTKKLVTSGKTLEIPVLDHLIITDNGYYSFADEGMI